MKSASCAFAVLVTAIAPAPGMAQHDKNWDPYRTEAALAESEIDISSRYVEMPDGVRIAIDLCLPRKRLEHTIPTGIRTTRYGRRYEMEPNAPKRISRIHDSAQRFVANGYAYVSVDERGTAASFGTWTGLTSPEQTRDLVTIVEWITNQPWSDGSIVAEGISYEGSTAEMLVRLCHPAVKASAPQFNAYDVFLDVGLPGGIYLEPLVERWRFITAAVDRNDPKAFNELANFNDPLAKFRLEIQPVDADQGGSMLQAAVKDHNFNMDVRAQASRLVFVDDVWGYDPRYASAAFSPCGYVAQFRRSRVPMYGFSGWFDGGYQHSAIKRWKTVKTPGSKLVIGPWNHGGWLKYDPDTQTMVPSQFDREQELLRFFDHYVKGCKTGINEENPIYYYTMVDERWKSTDTWPPREAKSTTFYFRHKNSLETSRPTAIAPAFDEYQVRYDTGTGTNTRWDTVFGRGNPEFPDRRDEDAKLLTYDTASLPHDMEVTGHPIVTLYVSSNRSDGQFFAYLEDVFPDGKAIQITEGCLRAIHRKLGDAKPPYEMAVPYRTYLQADAMPLDPGQIAELKFDLLPTSYVFKKGHRIRVALAGADKDHFRLPEGPPARLQYHRSRDCASCIELPVILE